MENEIKKFSLALVALIFLESCANPLSIQEIEVIAESNANSNSATRIEFLFLLDASLIDSLPASTSEWCANRDLLILNYSDNLLVSTIALAPDTRENLVLPQGHRRAEAVIVYADYILPSGQRWQRIPNNKTVQVILKQNTLQILEAKN